MTSQVDNKNESGFELECIVCGRCEGISLVAHRNSVNIVGFIAACRDHLDTVYSADFQILVNKKEDIL